MVKAQIQMNYYHKADRYLHTITVLSALSYLKADDEFLTRWKLHNVLPCVKSFLTEKFEFFCNINRE